MRVGGVARWKVVPTLVAALLALIAASLPGASAGNRHGSNRDKGTFRLTLLHNNDGESRLINLGAGLEDFGGVARFATVVEKLRDQADDRRGGRRCDRGWLFTENRDHHKCRKMDGGTLMVSSGDNFLAGPEFNASLQKGPPFYDAIAMDRIDYDAIALGNHDFDFGPDVLADFIESFRKNKAPWLSSNLDFSEEPRLEELEDDDRIAKSTVVKIKGHEIGIIGATTPQLRFISSPRNVEVIDDVAGAINDEVDELDDEGVNKIILISHLQSIQEDLALAPELDGIDIMVAGGGDELLANEDDLLVPGDEGLVFGPYPLTANDADGDEIPVVTTKGSYSYVGRLVVEFRRGKVVEILDDSGPVRVAGGDNPDAVRPDRFIQKRVVAPVVEAIEALAQNVIGNSEVALDGRRAFVRTTETNEGDLIADALLSEATRLATEFGAPTPQVSLQNGGGIRNDSIIGPGNITELDTFAMVPFPNFVSIVPDVPPAQFEEILENAVSRVEFVDGRFAQIGGFEMTWDASGTPQVLDANGNVTQVGTRVREVVLDDGTAIVQNGNVVPGAPALDIATIDFSARGGDQYPFRGAGFTTLGITYQQALANYIETTLGGDITAADYPEGGAGRITRLN